MMNIQTPYRTITREQFLFHEMKIVASLLKEGKNNDQVLEEIVKDNLFQYPTESMIKNIASVCLKRFNVENREEWIDIVANESSTVARQACLFLMMNSYRLVWEFMILVIGEKFQTKDLSFSKADLNSFFTRLQEQNDTVAAWSDSTITKCKQVLKKTLVEIGYLDNTRSDHLNPILLDFRVKEAIEKTNKDALIAFGSI